MSFPNIQVGDYEFVDSFWVGIPENLTHSERYKLVSELNELARQRYRAEFRAQHTGWTERDLQLGMLRELHGDPIADEVDRNWNPAWEKLPVK